MRGRKAGRELVRTIENAKRDGVRVSLRNAGSQSAGQIGVATNNALLEVVVRLVPEPDYVKVRCITNFY